MPGNVKLGIEIEVDGKQVKGFVGASEKDWNRFRRQLGGVEQSANRAGRSVLGLHNRVIGYAAGAISVAAAWRTATGAIADHARQERALALVEARVEATGAAAGRSAGEIAAMAAALQDATTFGDEEILEAQGILLTFGKIAEEAFDRASVAALDLAEQMGVDLRSATLQLAKALEDPERGVSALAESGTTFTQAQRDVINSLVETNRLAEAQALILDVVEAQYAGAAAAARDTLGGALEALGNTWGDLRESVAGSADEMLAARAAVEALNDFLGDTPRVLNVATAAAYGLGAGVTALVVAKNAGAIASAAMAARVAAMQGPMVAASIAARGLWAALLPLTGPLGLLAIAGGVAALTLRIREQGPVARAASSDIDEYRLSLGRLNEAQTIDSLAELEADIARMERRASGLRARLAGGKEYPLLPFLPSLEETEIELRDMLRSMQFAEEAAAAHRERLSDLRFVGPRRPADAPGGVESSGIDREIERITDRLRRRYLATEEGITESHRRERFLLQTMYGERSDAVAALEAEYDEKIAAIRDERARAEAEAATEHAEALLRSGLPALEALAAGNDELSGSVIRSRSALERERRERELGIQVRDAYAGATDEVVERLVEEHLRTDDLLRSQELQLDLLERYGPALVDYSDRLAAANELLESGALSAEQYARAVAEINIEAGQGGFADGWIAEIERVREASKNAGADIGASFAGVFGPDGVLAAGLAESTARMLVFGESSRVTFDDVLRQALSGFIAQMIQMGIQWVLLHTVFRATRKTGDASDLARVTAQTQATSFLAAQNAFASTAAIPVVGPALAPAAAATALLTAQSLGAGAVAATASKLAAFESGGVVDRPTFFGFGSQRQVGVSGEGGPEAIIPLVRGPSGDLGVRAQGADRDSARPVNVNISIHAVDAAGVDELLRERRMQIAGMVREALADEGRSL